MTIMFLIFANFATRHIMRSVYGILALSLSIMGGLTGFASQVEAQSAVPTLVITNDPLARAPSASPQPRAEIEAAKPQRSVDRGVTDLEELPPVVVDVPESETETLTGDILEDFNKEVQTATARRIKQLSDEYQSLQSVLASLQTEMRDMQSSNKSRAENYYANIAAIQTKLQTGTTPGNPRLVRRLSMAQEKLENLSDGISRYNTLAIRIGDTSSIASYLMQSVQATFGLSGAVQEDHAGLKELEDSVANAIVIIERLLTTVNEEITRSSAYLAAERRNLRTLSLAVANGDVYGANIANRLYTQVNQAMFPVTERPEAESMAGTTSLAGSVQNASLSTANMGAEPLSDARPLVVVRFDQPNVSYEQAVYSAVSEALDMSPDAQFEIVAVDPGAGNAARRAIEAARSKQNAEKVLRSLVQMGVNANTVKMSTASNPEARFSEVHIRIRG